MSCRRHQCSRGKRRAVALLAVLGLGLYLPNRTFRSRSEHWSSPPATGAESTAFIQGLPSQPPARRIWCASERRGTVVEPPLRGPTSDTDADAVDVELADLKQNSTASDIAAEPNDEPLGGDVWQQILGVTWLPDAVDALLAATGAGAALALVSALDGLSPVRLYAPPMAASAILIFAGVKLPAVKNVVLGSAGPALGSVLCSTILSQFVPIWVSRSVSVVIALAFFKWTGFFFPPAAAMAALGVENQSFAQLSWSYILFPAVTGNVLLYALALPLAALREGVKKTLTQQQWQMGTRDEKMLREIFDRCDLDSSGTIEVEELQLALKYLSGDDEVTLDDCQAFLTKADANGNGTLDFDEFTEVFANYEAYAPKGVARRK